MAPPKNQQNFVKFCRKCIYWILFSVNYFHSAADIQWSPTFKKLTFYNRVSRCIVLNLLFHLISPLLLFRKSDLSLQHSFLTVGLYCICEKEKLILNNCFSFKKLTRNCIYLSTEINTDKKFCYYKYGFIDFDCENILWVTVYLTNLYEVQHLQNSSSKRH